MNARRATTQPSLEEERRWRFHLLDHDDAEAVVAYEALLYRHFEPILPVNPLIRDLWDWDDARQRLRTRVPYAQQPVALISDAQVGALLFAASANIDLATFRQAETYGFARPETNRHASSSSRPARR